MSKKVTMTAKDLTLNIAVNLGRISRWAQAGKENGVRQFLNETEQYLNDLENEPKSDKFNSTYQVFKQKFDQMKSSKVDLSFAEDALTWANILTHRAKLA